MCVLTRAAPDRRRNIQGSGMTTRLATLPNGLRIVTDRIETVDTVSLGLWVDVGTRHEAPDLNGVAHFLEHMAFKGTERRSARAIAEEIEAVGGHLNAYTSRESTAYYAKVLKEDMPLALDILADILLHSTFDPAELERERTVILQEIGQANDTPDDIIFDHFQERAFPDQAMGRPVLGTPEIIGRLSRDAVVGYLRGHYSASRIVLSASGNLDHDRFVALAETCCPRCRPNCRSRPSRRVMSAATIARTAIWNSCTWCSGFPALRSMTRTITPPRCSRPRSAAGCRRGCSRRCARSAAWCTRSTPSRTAIATADCSGSTPEPARRRRPN